MMKTIGKRNTALFAELLADHLLEVYKDEHVPQSVMDFASAGFTMQTLIENPDQLYRMIVIAAYDRRPFTHEAKGYEFLWEMDGKMDGIPSKLDAKGLWTVKDVLHLSREEIRIRLSQLRIGNLTLETDGNFTKFADTLITAARALQNGLLTQLINTDSAKGIRTAFDAFDSVHGIGETIAAKLTKYLLREISIGKVKPADFSLDVAWPISQEWHIEGAAGTLERIGSDLLPLTAGVLVHKGDAFAIDALFYLHRRKPADLDNFVNDLVALTNFPIEAPVHQLDAPNNGIEVCRQLLKVIADVRDDGLLVTQKELDRKKIDRKLKTEQQIHFSCRKIYIDMERVAEKGNVSEMVRFYENCLNSPVGKEYDWILKLLGRKCLETEKERFMNIAGGAI